MRGYKYEPGVAAGRPGGARSGSDRRRGTSSSIAARCSACGSSGGASRTKARFSYLRRMIASRCCDDASAVSICFGEMRACHTAFALVLPSSVIIETSGSLHSFVSSSRERTLEMCTPRLRCMPEQLKQMNWPRLMLAHAFCASFCGQSAQMLLPGCLISAASRFRLRAASFSSAL